jgi:hypothetical protein
MLSKLLNQQMESVPAIRPLINIGALLDIPTGRYYRGKHGEHLLNGGLGTMVGVTGVGNSFKSTILHYMMLSAADKISATGVTSMTTYDTEMNIHLNRLDGFTKHFDNLRDKDVMDGMWTVTDRSIYSGNEWYEKLKDFLKSKINNKDKLTFESPFIDKKGKPVSMMVPTFTEIDSFSEFDTDSAAKIQDENELGENGANTIHLRLNLAKTAFLTEVGRYLNSGNHYLLTTAQQGKEVVISSGYGPSIPTKKLQYMKNGDKIKGVPDKYYFLNTALFQVYSAAPLINQATKGPEYPLSSEDNLAGDTDLNIVCMRQLRSKSGVSGNVYELIVSQREGVLPSLTEFHYIKSTDRFGISGSLQHYTLDLYPDVKLGRTTVRSKIDNDPLLRRAINITSELCQMHQYMRDCSDVLCTPAELYHDLKEMGYDWNVLLNTRGWWTLNNDEHSVPYLSTYDLLAMRKGTYKPYWLK